MRKVIIVIRDGWGYRKESSDNAIASTATPVANELMKNYPNVLLDASGKYVGLPQGYQGNSEVGHMTIGSGRIIYQMLVRIDKSIESGDFFKIQEFLDAIENCKKHNTALHIIGLLQTQGVHSHIKHLFALLDLCKQQDFTNVYVHAVTDGRDAPVHESKKHISSLLEKFKDVGFGKIATLSGRYYTMDRDKRWDRTKKSYDCIVNAEAEADFDDVLRQVQTCHDNDETDEFIKPRKADWYEGMKPNDSIIFSNYRTDRPRQLTKAIIEQEFDGWERKPLDVFYVSMTQFYRPMNCKVAFKDVKYTNLLGEVISKHGLKQFRTSETEKYAHVTFFFNGQQEKPFEGEDRKMISSPKVATYDLQPEMSLFEVTDNLLNQINSGTYDLIVVNFANPDMVGHTGVIEAIKKAVADVDSCVGKTAEAGLANDYTLIVFADHGNAEDQTPEWRTSHTINPVPCILVSKEEALQKATLKEGKGLQDIAPTVLDLMDIDKPEEMTGESFIQKQE
ncbi:2,3-bisphosphoglycerate-independent phosphoglycerate mutase [Candidatus Woesearchaeota archaeon]|nr:2,3-bisphosphoglycerate-independent phosphoglycerate mutase [Candidatus Woesearchaeota archaeon]